MAAHAAGSLSHFDWFAAGLRYYSYNHFLRHRFGGRVQKVSVDAGFTCPNVDGTVAIGGCTFCDNRSFSPSRRLPRQAIGEQIDEGIRQLRRRYHAVERFMAYFQPATNTYAPVERLRAVYEEALAHPQRGRPGHRHAARLRARRRARPARAKSPAAPTCRSSMGCKRFTIARSTG